MSVHAATVSDVIAEALGRRGVRRMFGVPGGGSNLPLIDAAAARGIDYVLTASEAGAALMAAVTGEISGAPGVAVTTLGPGAANAVNGAAYATLERAPLALITDCAAAGDGAFAAHQRYDQDALFAPIAKASQHIEARDAAAVIEALLDLACAHPRGSVHIDLSTAVASAQTDDYAAVRRPVPRAVTLDREAVTAARALLARSVRPVILAGLEARGAADALAELARMLGAPVLTTYKAKGVIAHDDPHFAGLITGGTAESDAIGRADLIVQFGFDPVELLPHRWRYGALVLDLAAAPRDERPVTPAAALTGPLPDVVEALRGVNCQSAWDLSEPAALREAAVTQLAAAAGSGDPERGVHPHALAAAVAAAAPEDARATVDAGAHMFSAMAVWPARAPYDVLKSNGLSTMAYALPAAIAAALHEPARPVVALTGDGGLAMGLGELATAARLGLDIKLVVFNDAALSLIDIKQQRDGRAPRGVRYPRLDFAGAAAALGWQSHRIEHAQDLDNVLGQAFASAGPVLVDVFVDPAPYSAQMRALRG
jgi:acetolactate synthase-1/2/3 large subunit